MLLFETVKNLIFWIVTHVSTRDYMVCTFNRCINNLPIREITQTIAELLNPIAFLFPNIWMNLNYTKIAGFSKKRKIVWYSNIQIQKTVQLYSNLVYIMCINHTDSNLSCNFASFETPKISFSNQYKWQNFGLQGLLLIYNCVESIYKTQFL